MLKNLNNIFFKKAKYIVTDTRELKKGQIFLALRGKNHDGHNFIPKAIELGAEFVISEKEFPELNSQKISVVENTLTAYQQIAHEYLNAVNPLVIGITGSSGKTTTKELLFKILKNKFKVHATEKNYNNEIGVPKTILEMPEDTQVLILEMAMRGLGEISQLSKIARPNLAIITNIGTAHIERLGSKENIRKAKLEIIDGLNAYKGWIELDSYLIIDEENSNFVREQNLVKNLIEFNSKAIYKLNALSSEGLNADSNAAAKVAQLLGLSEEEVQEGLLEYQAAQGRGNIVQDSERNIYIDDSYNANPESVRNSINAMCNEFKSKKKIAVIGEIAESLPELVENLFIELSQKKEILLIDARNKKIEDVKNEIENELDGNSVVLIKASRLAALERLLPK